jgi:hypothetical protein
VVKLTLSGYYPYEEEILFPDESPLVVPLEKYHVSSDYADIQGPEQDEQPVGDGKVDFTIKTVPPGATISIKGEKGVRTGTSPVTFQVIPGTFTVRARISDYKDNTSTVVVGNNGKTVDIVLEHKE